MVLGSTVIFVFFVCVTSLPERHEALDKKKKKTEDDCGRVETVCSGEDVHRLQVFYEKI